MNKYANTLVSKGGDFVCRRDCSSCFPTYEKSAKLFASKFAMMFASKFAKFVAQLFVRQVVHQVVRQVVRQFSRLAFFRQVFAWEFGNVISNATSTQWLR